MARSSELRHRNPIGHTGRGRPTLRMPVSDRILLPPTRGRLVAGLAIAVIGSLLAAPMATSSTLARFSGLPFFVVIVSATLVGRLLSGILSAVFAGVLLETYVIPRLESSAPGPAGELVAIAAFAFVALTVGAVLARLDRATAEGESARERVALVSDVSELLAQELHYPAAFQRLAEVLSRGFADLVLIDTIDHQGAVERVVALHRDPAKQLLADELRSRFAPSLSGKHPVARVVRGGGAEYASEMPVEFLRETTNDEEHFRLVTELGFCSFMCMPLEARGRILGALTLVSTTPAHRYGPEDLQLGKEIARRAGVRIENARLYEEQRHIASTLQRSLLPTSLPVVPGVEVAVRYWAQGEGTEVGGDFYDLFGTSSNTWMLMVGDVCGKGPEAAGFVGAARHSARALATQGLGPVPLLEALNLSLIDLPADGRFCTAVIAEIRQRDRGIELVVAAAGHPAPLVVRRDGSIFSVDAKGALLGVFEEIHLTTSTLSLEPGDSVFFYTDGALERPAGDVGRTRDLSALLRGAERSSLDEVLGRIEQELKPGTLLDDVALAALRVTG